MIRRHLEGVLEQKVTNAENALLMEDRNIGTSIANTAIATTGTVARGFLSILQVGTGAAQGVEDIERGLSDKGDGWDIAIGVSRMLSDAGEVASTALAVAGAGEKAVQTAQVSMIKREMKLVQAQRNAGGLSKGQMTELSEKLGELGTKKQFLEAGYSRPVSLKEPIRTLKDGPGNVKRIAKNKGNVRQGVDQSYRSVKPGASKDVAVEAKGLSKPPSNARQARVLGKDKQNLIEGADNWNLDRLRDAANSGNKNAQEMLKRLAGDAPESYLSVTNVQTGQTTVSRLQGATGRPVATPLSGLENVSPVGEAVGTAVVDNLTRDVAH